MSTDLKWLSPEDAPFQIIGFAWPKEEGKYRRLPVSSPYPLRDIVDVLADCTAGGQIHFQTNSTRLSVRVTLSKPSHMYHMTAIAQCGFDCYIGQFGSQLYYSTTTFDRTLSNYESELFESLDPKMRNIVLNFPLYQGVNEVLIGLDTDAEVISSPSYLSNKRIIAYGTSITQGGCASRPGMAYTNIMSRRLPYEFINLGFSGNGKGEPELAHLIASIERPGLLVLDYEANVSLEEYRETLPKFIQIYREKHAYIPILIVSRIRFSREHEKAYLFRERIEFKLFAKETVDQLRANGDDNIYCHDGENLLGDNYLECTVDGVHPSDLGFLMIADALTPIFTKLL